MSVILIPVTIKVRVWLLLPTIILPNGELHQGSS